LSSGKKLDFDELQILCCKLTPGLFVLFKENFPIKLYRGEALVGVRVAAEFARLSHLNSCHTPLGLQNFACKAYLTPTSHRMTNLVLDSSFIAYIDMYEHI
jgi:hypothetical protein